MKAKVSVKEEHILRGERKSCNSCPIALAILEAIPDLSFIQVDYKVIWVKILDDLYSAKMPKQAYEFMWDFDNTGQGGKPFEMELHFSK